MFWGFIHATLSACTYGLVALLSVPLLREGLSFPTISFYRFILAALMIAPFVVLRARSWKPLLVSKSDIWKLLGLSFFYAGAALTFMAAFNHMDTGIVVTVQFCYPLFVMLIMVLFFGERFRISTAISSLLIVAGVSIFSLQDVLLGASGVNVPFGAMMLTIFSAVLLAFYVVGIQVAKVECKSALVTAMYIMLGTGLFCGLYGIAVGDFSLSSVMTHGKELALIAFVSGAVSNICLVYAVRYVGSSLTAILGGLEPVTAMLAGVYLLGEQATWGNALGVLCILSAVGLVALASRTGR